MINVNELYLQAKGSWKSLYPIYFDSTKTVAQEEIAGAVSMLHIRNLIQPHKCYSRDYFNIGRLKAELIKDGKPANPAVPSKKIMLKKVAENIKKARKDRETAKK